ncbi:MAG: helix-turn-helix domain-containing protein [Wenzhouxiangellaceae bacterium]
MEDLADRIRRARRIKGWSQTRLAESLGVTPGAVGHWERPDGSQPSSEHLIEIAKQLSVNHEWLAVGRGEMLPRDSKRLQPGVISLSDGEQMLVERYQELPPPSRVLLLHFLDALVTSPEAFTGSGAARSDQRIC